MTVKKIALILCGSLSLAVGTVGILIPILPTTPFVLLSAACFCSSSPRIYKGLLNTKYFGDFIDNYKNKTGIANTVKIKVIVFLWATLIIAAVVFQSIITSVILLVVGVAVTIHILTIKSR